MTAILWGLLASGIGVVNTGVYQRALSLSASLGASPFFRAFYMNAICVILIGAVVLVPGFSPSGFRPMLDSWMLLLAVVSISASGIATGMMSQYAYSNEKIGVLAPFGETGRVLTILAGFFLLGGTSVTAFVSALLAGVAILAGSIDFKNFKINRYSAVLASSGILRAYSAICSGWVLISLSPVPFVFADVLFGTLVTFAFVFREGFPKLSKNSSLKMGKAFLLNDFLWFVSYLISLLLLKELGVVVASLLGMVSMVATVAYGRFFLNEPVGKKTVLLALFVSGCVVSGSYFS